MTKPPTGKDKHKKKTVDKKDYWWCPNHNSWTRHKPSECRGVNTLALASSDATPSSTSTGNTSGFERGLRLANALEAVTQDE